MYIYYPGDFGKVFKIAIRRLTDAKQVPTESVFRTRI